MTEPSLGLSSPLLLTCGVSLLAEMEAVHGEEAQICELEAQEVASTRGLQAGGERLQLNSEVLARIVATALHLQERSVVRTFTHYIDCITRFDGYNTTLSPLSQTYHNVYYIINIFTVCED